jgi:hypothetical protein
MLFFPAVLSTTSSLSALPAIGATGWLVVLVITLVGALAWGGRRGGRNRPPMLPGWIPLLGHLHRFDPKQLHKTIAPLAKSMQSGVFQLYIGQKLHLAVTSCEGIAEMYYGPNAAHFNDRQNWESGRIISESPDGVYQHAFLGPNNAWHQWARKLGMQQLLSAQRVREQMPLLLDTRDRLLTELAGVASSAVSAGAAVNPALVLERAPLRVIYQLMLGEDLPEVSQKDALTGSTDSELVQWLQEMRVLSGATNPGDYIPVLNTLGLNPMMPRVLAWIKNYDKYLLPFVRSHQVGGGVNNNKKPKKTKKKILKAKRKKGRKKERGMKEKK